MNIPDILRGEILYFAVDAKNAAQYNRQSCDCDSAVIVMRDKTVKVDHRRDGEDGYLSLGVVESFDRERFRYLITPSNQGAAAFVKAHFYKNGKLEEIKYRFDDRYLFIFAGEHELIITKSIPDLFEEDDTVIPETEDSVLFDFQR